MVIVLYGDNLEVTVKGIINVNTKKILNTHITTVPMTYTFSILKDKYGRNGIYKEVRLASSQAQCYAPLNQEKDIYRIYNIYCYDREISNKHIQPIFYIYNMQGVELKKLTFDSIDYIKPSYGKQDKQNILFNDIKINMNNIMTKANIECTVPGKDFFNSNFEYHICNIKNLKDMISSLKEKNSVKKMQYFDISLIENTIGRIPLTFKTLTSYNNIAYYLQKAGANNEAVLLLKKIVAKFPNRTVAYYNLGDAYWALEDKEKACKAYIIYIEQMCDKGLQKKIPKKVLERVK